MYANISSKMCSKRLALTLLSLILIMHLAACASAGGKMHSQDGHTLVYANLSPSGPDREAIDEFNKTHTDVQIEVRDYCDENGEPNRTRLLAEVLSGNGPDIIDMGTGPDAGSTLLPYRQMAQKGYLEDLWPYIESDPELGREAVVEAPLKAAEVGGGLYIAFSSVNINTLIGAERVVGDRTSWSAAELREVFASMPEGSTVLEYFIDKRTALFYLSYMVLDDYINWETSQCSFDCAEFRSMLEFINDFFPVEFNLDSEDINAAAYERWTEGLQMLQYAKVSSLAEIQYYDYLFGGRTAFIGYPVEDGSVGSSFHIMSKSLAISSACQNKAAAWDFIRRMFLPQYSEASIRNLDTGYDLIHINRADYRLLKDIDLSDSPRARIRRHPDGSVYEYRSATAEESRCYDDFINSIDKIDLSDQAIFEIVQESCGPYFAGDKTLDETVALIQNRVTLYVNEQK